ncbi:MAG: hypothetical protein ACTSUP_03355 [Candidatus Heimdallarchaeaceae archaeon]
MSKQEPLIFGIDLSLNHWAVCQVDYITGKCIDYKCMTDKKGEYDKNVAHAFLLKGQDKKGGESKENYEERRKQHTLENLTEFVCFDMTERRKDPVYVSIEGYAYAASSRGIIQIAEVTGCLKSILYKHGKFVRIHDPLSVKLYATGKGNCLKKDVILKAREYGFDIPENLIKKVIKKFKNREDQEEYDGPGTDLADAFFLARILRTELMLREGIEDLKNIGENERRIFLRTTKAFPENILSRPFVYDTEKRGK